MKKICIPSVKIINFKILPKQCFIGDHKQSQVDHVL
jgi:hypothetical protein